MVDPTGYTALDLIGFTDKGDYNPLSTYNKNDLANYNGTKWRCKVDDTIGVTPSEGLTWTAFMVLPTDHTMDMIAPVETSPSANAYVTGKQLIFNEVLYDVIDDIAIGDTLEVGVNIDTSDTIVEQIEDANDAIAQNASDIGDLDASKMSWADYAKTGAYNLCPNTATTQVINGITFTVNSDGSVTANGTLTTSYAICPVVAKTSFGNLPIPNGTYKGVGCPSTGYTGTAAISINFYNLDGSGDNRDYGSGTTVNYVSGSDYNVSIIVSGGVGKTISNAVFKPMITTDLNATYDDYQPYAMTNRELTKDVTSLQNCKYHTSASGLKTITCTNQYQQFLMTVFKGSARAVYLITQAGSINTTHLEQVYLTSGQTAPGITVTNTGTYTFTINLPSSTQTNITSVEPFTVA